MIKHLKRALTESYIGAIALGWLLADAIIQFANALVTPFNEWVTRKAYPGMAHLIGGTKGVPFQLALPGLVRFLLILVIWCVLVRWLYYGPSNAESAPTGSMPSTGVE